MGRLYLSQTYGIRLYRKLGGVYDAEKKPKDSETDLGLELSMDSMEGNDVENEEEEENEDEE